MNICLKNKKRIFAVILAFFVVLTSVVGIFGKIDSYAEDVSIVLAIWPTDVKIGDAVTATVTITGESLGEYDIFLEYPSSILQYTGGDATGTIEIKGNGANTLTYNFKAIANGEGKIQTSGYKLYDTNGTQLSVVHAGGNIIVGEVAETDEKIKIGNDTYTLVNDRKLPSPPEGYKISSVTYNDKEIYAYQSPTQNIKVVCLQNDEWEQKWFVYDEEKKEFSPFVEYSLDGVSYVIINKPDNVEIPDIYSETSLTLDGSQLVAYTDNSDSGLYLVYALNQTGDADLYFFDTNEGSIIRYAAIESLVENQLSQTEDKEEVATPSETTKEKTVATPLIPQKEKSDEEDEGFFTKSTLQKLLYMMVVLFIIMCVVVIILIIRNGMLQSQLYGEDYEDDDDDIIVEKAKQDAKQTASDDPMTMNQIKTGKNNSYDVNEDTGEILLVEAADNNSSVNVPPAEDNESDKIEKAMAERPYGYDSAFDVVTVDEAPEGEHVYREPEPDTDSFIDPSKFDQELERKNLNAKNKLRAIQEADKEGDDTSSDEPGEVTEAIDLSTEDDTEEISEAIEQVQQIVETQEQADDDIKTTEEAFQLVDEQPSQSFEDIPLQTAEEPISASDSAEMPTTILTQDMAPKKKINTPQKVALPGMDEDDDE